MSQSELERLEAEATELQERIAVLRQQEKEAKELEALSKPIAVTVVRGLVV